jgi:predicted secreted Zn-dependent protease
LALLLSLLVAACGSPAFAVLPVEPQEPAATLVLEETQVLSGPVPVTLSRSVWLQPYLVSGSTESAIRKDLDARGPHLDPDGRRYDAQTAWSLELYPRRQNVGGTCRLTAATVELKEVMALPQLSDAASLEARLRERWERYRAALEKHEMGHVQRHHDSVREEAARLSETPPSSCAELQQRLESWRDGTVEVLRAADRDYDASTGHGATEGAVFP